MGRDKAPDSKSANAMLMTKNKLLLRSLLLKARRTRVRKFPRTIKRASNVKAMHQAIPSALEGSCGVIVDELVGKMVVGMFFIVRAFHETYKKMGTLSAQTQSMFGGK